MDLCSLAIRSDYPLKHFPSGERRCLPDLLSHLKPVGKPHYAKDLSNTIVWSHSSSPQMLESLYQQEKAQHQAFLA